MTDVAEVRDVPEADRYEARVNGELAGFAFIAAYIRRHPEYADLVATDPSPG